MFDQLDMLNQLSALKRQSIVYFWLINIIVLAGVSALIQVSHAETPKDVKWGGVWLRGSDSERKKFYPVGDQFARRVGSNQDLNIAEEYSNRLIKDLLNISKPSGKRIVDRLQNTKYVATSSGQAFVLACAVNYEFFEKTQEAGESVVYAEVGFEMLVCDFATRKVIFSLPSRLQYKDLWQGEKHINSQIRKIYEERLPKSLLDLAKKTWDGETSFQTVGFGKVDVWDGAKKAMPARFQERPEFYLSTLFASTFSKSVDIPVMPFLKGKEAVYTGLVTTTLEDSQNITNLKMTGAGKDVFFVLQEPNYVFDLIFPAYRDVRGDGDGVVDTSLHYAFAKVTLKGGAGGIIFDKKYEEGVRRAIGKGEKVRPLWLASWDATSKLFGKAAKDIGNSKDNHLSSCKLR
jgi:hypothetical protein